MDDVYSIKKDNGMTKDDLVTRDVACAVKKGNRVAKNVFNAFKKDDDVTDGCGFHMRKTRCRGINTKLSGGIFQ